MAKPKVIPTLRAGEVEGGVKEVSATCTQMIGPEGVEWSRRGSLFLFHTDKALMIAKLKWDMPHNPAYVP